MREGSWWAGDSRGGLGWKEGRERFDFRLPDVDHECKVGRLRRWDVPGATADVHYGANATTMQHDRACEGVGSHGVHSPENLGRASRSRSRIAMRLHTMPLCPTLPGLKIGLTPELRGENARPNHVGNMLSASSNDGELGG